ncbi:hypothetical protein VP1G_05064 [Cytospora mali]|uniref:Aminoglycoside phosphotransferase domain-containing protein n=1 Tax=Cytospora mali TaxID=578113 RepID=A0A194V1H1_CYTMA|nr:hypothetical protein VP1G_05064 [Valsa mali var. pyri (nom. inval.)]
MADEIGPDIVLPLVSPASLSGLAVDFPETSFFTTASAGGPRSIPAPSQVLAKHDVKSPYIVVFKELKLVVKYGDSDEVRLEEAIVMRTIRKAFPDGQVPVPEVFGWRVVDGKNFIYMSLMPGVCLGDIWNSLSRADKRSICGSLGRVVSALGRLRQDASTRLIGSICGGKVQEKAFNNEPHKLGPFSSVQDFNKVLLTGPSDPFQFHFSANYSIRFAHGDLNVFNILVSDTHPIRITGVVDWEHSGWFPEYWEFCTMLHINRGQEIVAKEYLGRIFRRRFDVEKTMN